MKKVFASILVLALIIGALPAFAYSYSYNNPAYESYIVTSTHAKGIIYLYDKASSVTGKNLGAYKNNTVIKAINYNYNKEFAFVVCPDGKVGYMRKDWLTKQPTQEEIDDTERYIVFSTDPAGFAYMYDMDSDYYGKNLGRYDNWDEVEIIDINTGSDYAFVRGIKDGTYGYIRKAQLYPASLDPVLGCMMVNAPYPYTFVYLYDKPNDVTGKNIGKYDDGTVVGIIKWNCDRDFCQVYIPSNGAIGYVHRTWLSEIYF